MFRKMRRFRQQLPQEEAELILRSSTSGVLALLGDDDYPYALPMSHVYHNGKLYFHGAMDGHKADAVRSHPKASYCVIAQDDVVPHRFTALYRSVIAFGRVREVESDEEKRDAIMALAKRYGAQHMPRGEAEIQQTWKRLMMIALDIEHMTGKESRELMADRERARAKE